MVRSRWIGALAGVLSFLAPAAAALFFTVNQIITVREADKPVLKCKVLRTWTERDGTRLCEAQALDTGEKMTIVEPKGTGKEGVRIVHAAPAKADGPALSSPYSTKTAFSKAEPPVDGKWRESWGKVERWTEEDTRKAEAESARRAAAASPRLTPPTARKATAEPLLAPEKFTKVPAVTSATPPAVASAPKVQTVSQVDVPAPPAPLAPPQALLPGDPVPRPSLWSRLTARVSAAAPARRTTPAPEADPRSPFGMASVSAAHALMLEEQQTAGKGKPAKVERPEGAFMMPAVSLPGGPTVTDRGVPEGMSNAFTTGVTSRPLPADFGIGFDRGPSAFAPRQGGPLPPVAPPAMQGVSAEQQAALAMHHQMMMAQYLAATRGNAPAAQPQQPVYPQQLQAPQPTAVATAPPSVTPALIATLQKSALPSEREMAADQLKRVDWKSEADVVPALVQSAQHPAPMVRVSCVRALGQMKASTPLVLDALETLKADQDVRVRQEAAGTLSSLGAKR